MVALRQGSGLKVAPFGLAAIFFVFGSTPTGPQDAASVVVQRQAAEPAGEMVGAALAAAAPGWGTQDRRRHEPMRSARLAPNPAVAQIDRARKGDLLVPRIQIELAAELLREDAAASPPAEPADELDAAVRFKPFPAYDVALSLEADPKVPREPAESGSGEPGEDGAGADAREFEVLFGTGRLYFDAGPMGVALAAIEPWETGQAPVVLVPTIPETAVAAASPESAEPSSEAAGRKQAALTDPGDGGEARRLVSPAVRLGLAGKARAKAEKCLANAVYFESRSEPLRGQIAVAQVVLNRAFSGYYPEDVCGVVYQGANRHLSCQFTFACDGIPDVVTEPEHWQRAMRIARAALDGKIWLADVGKATHYHASYVYPYWVRSMRKLKRIGLHTFYRPRRWGDGSDEPSWGSAAGAEIAANL